MSEIPEDIQETVRSLFDAVCQNLFHPALWDAVEAAILAERKRSRWHPIETAPKDGTRFLAAEPDDGWLIGAFIWCKTSHVPLYGFHFTDGDPENWNIAKPTHWQPLPTPPTQESATPSEAA